MKIFDNKRGITSGSSGGLLEKVIGGLVLVTVLFLVAAALVPEAQAAGDNLSGSGVPLGSLFAGDGVVFVIIMAAILLAVLAVFALSKRRGR